MKKQIRLNVPEEQCYLDSRSWGATLKHRSNILNIIQDNDISLIEIIIPTHITSVSLRFLEGLLDEVIYKIKFNNRNIKLSIISESKYAFHLYLREYLIENSLEHLYQK